MPLKKNTPKITKLRYHKVKNDIPVSYEVQVSTSDSKIYALAGIMCEGFFTILINRAKKDHAKIVEVKTKHILSIAHY